MSVMGKVVPPRNNEEPCTGGRPWPPRSGIPRTLSEENVNHDNTVPRVRRTHMFVERGLR
jgi:hypothetical protein